MEIALFYIIGVGEVEPVSCGLGFFNYSAIAFFKNLCVINVNVAYSVVELVSGGEYTVHGECRICLV